MYEFLTQLADIVFPYFSAPYIHEPNQSISREITINGEKELMIINRPNHGFIFSMRQAMLTKDIMQIIGIKDEAVIKKIMFLSAFQRSGRESEISSKSAPQLYKQYENTDVENFKHAASMYMFTNGLFHSTEEIDSLAFHIHWDNKSYISSIIHTAHILDLRRIPHFDMNRVKKEARERLFQSESGLSGNIRSIRKQKEIIDIIFNKSGLYLQVTGDRDAIKRRDFFSDRFFIFSSYSFICANTLDYYF